MQRQSTGREVEPVSELPAPHGARLKLEFAADCWVLVRDFQDTVLVRGLQSSAQPVELTAVGPLELSLAYWPAVKVTYNGRPVNLAGRGDHNTLRLRVGEN